MKVQIVTFNLEQQRVDLTALTRDDEADVLVYGFQECKTYPYAFIYNDVTRFTHELYRPGFTCIHTAIWGGLCLIVLARTTITVKDICGARVGVGPLYMANKGSLSVRMDLPDGSYCFVLVHLHAHTEYHKKRMQQVHDILSRSVFSNFGLVDDHEHVFLFGDVNSRLDVAHKDRDLVMQAMPKREKKVLMELDQLNREIGHGLLQHYREGRIKFDPTYKVKGWTTRNQVVYSTQRVPAWCDRILHSETIQCLAYDRQLVRGSDHLPVSGLYACTPVKPTRRTRSYSLDPHWRHKDTISEYTTVLLGLLWFLVWTVYGWLLLSFLTVRFLLPRSFEW
jgi:hypothetical protein